MSKQIDEYMNQSNYKVKYYERKKQPVSFNWGQTETSLNF